METINASAFTCEKSSAMDTENYEIGGSEEATTEVVESFELLHQSIPWLQKAHVSSDSYKGQLKILQAAIDYIIDLEEQLTEHMSEDVYRVALRESKAALERTLAASSRRPFADVNNAAVEDEDDEADISLDSAATEEMDDDVLEQHHHHQHAAAVTHFQMQPSFLTPAGEELQHRSA